VQTIATAFANPAQSSTQLSSQSPAQPLQCIAAFAARSSFEVTRLAPGDIEALRTSTLRQTPIYVSAVPARPLADQIDTAIRLAAAGFEPVPHIAVRGFASDTELDRHLGRLSGDAGVRRVLVVGGDSATPTGSFHAAIEVIESGLLHARGIAEVGIAGYPDGHPCFNVIELDRALAAKIEAASSTGLAVHIVTQFGFSAPPIL